MGKKKGVYWIGAQEDGKIRTTLWVRKETWEALREYASRRLARSRGGGLRVSEALDSLVRIAFECILRHSQDDEEPEGISWQEARQEGLAIGKRPNLNTYTLVDGVRVKDPPDDEI